MRKNLKITEEVHGRIKKHCDENHLKMSDWASSILLKKIEETICTFTDSQIQKTESVT